MAPSSQAAYAKDEKVLCFHHELLYEAKVTDTKLTDSDDKKSPFLYRVHYKGWKNTYVYTGLLSGRRLFVLFMSFYNLGLSPRTMHSTLRHCYCRTHLSL